VPIHQENADNAEYHANKRSNGKSFVESAHAIKPSQATERQHDDKPRKRK
jgi:hypothetical protein